MMYMPIERPGVEMLSLGITKQCTYPDLIKLRRSVPVIGAAIEFLKDVIIELPIAVPLGYIFVNLGESVFHLELFLIDEVKE